jgi:hypothetical protein
MANTFPKSGATDPGWRQPVVELTYLQNRTTRDRRWSLPDQVDAREAVSCAFSATSSQMTQSSEYQSTLQKSIKWSAGGSAALWSAAFSGNLEYKTITSEIESAEEIYVSAGSTCQTYIADFKAFTPVNVTQEFRNGVAQMPISFDSPSDHAFFKLFFDSFGTSYASEIQMGAMASYMYSFSTQNYTKMKSQDVNINAAADVAFFAKFGFNAMQSSHYQDYLTFSSNVAKNFAVGIGAAPPVSSNLKDWSAWQKEVSAINSDSTPFPMRYTLESIANLLTSDNFPADPSISKKFSALTKALHYYCGVLIKDCGPPPVPAVGNWRTYGGNSQRTFSSAHNGPTTSNLLWTHQILNDDGWPLTFNTTVYIWNEDKISALDEKNGNSRWFSISNANTPAVSHNGSLYIILLNKGEASLASVDPSTGSISWTVSYWEDTPFDVTVGPDGTIFVTDDASIYAISPSGEKKWKTSATGFPMGIPSVDSKGRVYWIQAGYLWACDASGNTLWKTYAILANETTGTVAIASDGTLYLTSMHSATGQCMLLAFDPSGSLKWTQTFISPTCSQPSVSGAGLIYVILTLRIAEVKPSGESHEIFGFPSALGTPVIDSNGILFLTTLQNPGYSIVAVDPKTASPIWTFPFDEADPEFTPIIAIGGNGLLLFRSKTTLYAIQDKGTSELVINK